MAMLKLLLAWCAVRLSSAALTCGAPAPDDGGSPFQNQANMEQQGRDLSGFWGAVGWALSLGFLSVSQGLWGDLRTLGGGSGERCSFFGWL